MTIAACYVSNEGVVLGADSTTTYFVPPNSFRHYNNAQKLFEIGELGSTLGLVTWGMGSLPNHSYRQLVAELSDGLLTAPPHSVLEVAQRWSDRVWNKYESQLFHLLQMYRAVNAKPAKNQADHELLAQIVQNSFVGFCVGGHVSSDRTPTAFEVLFIPSLVVAPVPTQIQRNLPVFWGVPNYMDRLLKAIDEGVYNAILSSPHWTAQQSDLDALILPRAPRFDLNLPLREAIDWIFSSIFITIKGIKFSKDPPYCGGPIEVAAITADRRFRWICHKGLDQALTDHAARGTY